MTFYYSTKNFGTVHSFEDDLVATARYG